MKKLLLLIFVCCLPVSFVYAQDDERIEYGETVTGEITNQSFEVAYEFVGKQDDVIVIEMEPVDALGDLDSPALLLLNSENQVVADTSDLFTVGTTKLAVELPANDTYSLIATRTDGRAGDDVGEFTIRLLLLNELFEGVEREGTTGSDLPTNYYVIRQDGEPFTLTYEKLGGEFSPAVSVNVIQDNGLTDVISISGDGLEYGQVRLPSASGVYIISVEEALFDFSFDEENADYALSIS